MTVSYSGQKKGGKRNVKFRRSGTLIVSHIFLSSKVRCFSRERALISMSKFTNVSSTTVSRKFGGGPFWARLVATISPAVLKVPFQT